MKAVVWADYGRLELQDLPMPAIQSEEVLVRVRAASLCTTDVGMIERGLLGVSPPQIIGHEVCGVVEKRGPRVTGLGEGDRVVLEPPVPCRTCRICRKGFPHLCPHTRHIGIHIPGGMAEYVAIDYRNAHRVPEGLTDHEAALTEPVAVCLAALEKAGQLKHKTVVLVGDGPFGAIFCALVRSMDAAEVVVVGHHENRLQQCRALGARAINALTDDPVPYVLGMTEGLGADVVVEGVGSAEILVQQCQPMLGPRGTIVLFSGIEGAVPLDLHALHFKEQSIVGSTRSLNHFSQAMELMVTGAFRAKELITHVMELWEFQEGFRLMMKEKNHTMKVVLTC